MLKFLLSNLIAANEFAVCPAATPNKVIDGVGEITSKVVSAANSLKQASHKVLPKRKPYHCVTLLGCLLVTGLLASFPIFGKTPGQPGRATVLSNQSKAESQDPPEGLSASEWADIKSAIERDRYAPRPVESASNEKPIIEFQNPAHGMVAQFDRTGLTLQSSNNASWALKMRLVGWGREGDLKPLPAVDPLENDSTVEYRHDGLTEWFVNGPKGLEQGFTVHTPASGDKTHGLELLLTLDGDLTVGNSASGSELFLTDSSGSQQLRYSGLIAWDARGIALPARMTFTLNGLRLEVEDHGAIYPVTIDPTFISEQKVSGDKVGELCEYCYFGGAVAIAGETVVIGAAGDGLFGAAYVFTRTGGTWTEQQKLISGQSQGFGTSVAISGDTAVTGSAYDNDNGINSGAAYVYTRSGNVWTQQQKLTASDATNGDEFGISVAVAGNTAVIGAHNDDDSGTSSGSAYVFFRSGSSWSEQGKLLASDGAANNYFGFSVDVSADTAVVGAYGEDDHSGSAYVFLRSGVVWSEQQKLTGSDGSSGDYFGSSVAIDGDTALIGAAYNSGSTDTEGSAYIFTRSATVWSEQQKLVASDPVVNKQFGNSVALSGSTAVVGAVVDNDGFNVYGSAYVFTLDEGIWTEQYKLLAGDSAFDTHFGWAVATDGDSAIIGADFYNENGMRAGSAYVFTRSETTWSEQQRIPAGRIAEQDYFGSSVALSVNTAIIGAYGDDVNGDASGSAYIFIRDASNWIIQQKLIASDGAAGDQFGNSVAISGDTALVGAHADDDSGNGSGSAYVFIRSGDSWSEQQKLNASDAAASDHFGSAVSIDGDTALIGARGDSDNGSQSGSAYAFTRSGSVWSEQDKLTASDGAASDYFGIAVALSGDTAVIGADQDDDNAMNSGSAYAFTRSGTVWSEQDKLTAGDGAIGDYFGSSVALSGDTAVIGAPQDDDDAVNSGSAYVFTRSGTVWSEQDKLTAGDGTFGDLFGSAVALSGDTAVIGAFQDDDKGQLSGSAYVFTRSGTSWTEQGKLTASDAAGGDSFGKSVAVSSDAALIGAYYDDDDLYARVGSAYFYQLAFFVGGNVNGLTGIGLQLQNNATDDLAVTDNGDFAFNTPLADGAGYAVIVLTQPTNPSQTCEVENGSGTISATDVANVIVTCTTDKFTIGGTVSGLSGSGLVLQNNIGDDLPITADGNFTFATALEDGSAYSVTVVTQPSNPSQTCNVSSETGTLDGANITDVVVTCTTDTFTIGGTVNGLSGSGLVLQKNTGDDLAITTNGPFAFAIELLDETSYSVTVLTQPTNPSQTCTITSGAGTLAGANITDVAVNCTTDTFTIGGTVTGLVGAGLVLQNNGTDDLPINSDGNFTFATALDDGSDFEVTEFTRPIDPPQSCSVANGTGTLSGANYENVVIDCVVLPEAIFMDGFEN